MIAGRVKGFTILEVTITMLITGIVIGITYSIYVIVIQSYASFNTKNNAITIVTSLDHALKRDFDRADTVLKDSAGVKVCIAGNVIRYSFYPDFVLRQSTKIDTFKVVVQNVITKFEEIPLGDLQNSDELNRVDQFDYILQNKTDSIPYHYFKNYSSENLIQRNPNAIY